MQRVFSSLTILEAHIVAGLLESHGLTPHVAGHYLQGAVGELPVSGFAHVLVNDDDVAVAESIIADYESGKFASSGSD